MYFIPSVPNRFGLHRRGLLAVRSPTETSFPPPLLTNALRGAQELLSLSKGSTRITSYGYKSVFPVGDVITASAKLTNRSLWM